MTSLATGAAVAEALALAGLPPAAVRLLLAAAPPALVALAAGDPAAAAAEILESQSGKMIRQGLDQAQEAPQASPAQPPEGLSGADLLHWARANNRT